MSQVLESIGVALAKLSWSVHMHTSFTAQTSVGGRVFRVPIAQGMGLPLLSVEPPEERFALLVHSVLAARPGAVLDVGANVGRFMLYAASADHNQRYVGFDVHPACVQYIQRIIDLNDLKSSSALAVGLSDHTGAMMLQTGSRYDVSATVVPGHYPSDMFAQSYPVCVTQGDTIVGDMDLGPIALIKIDVEGGEIEVVKGLAQTIAVHKPAIVVEVAPYAHIKDVVRADFRRNRAKRLEMLLRGAGYQFSKINDGNKLTPVPSLDPGSSTDYHEMDYLCTPLEFASVFRWMLPH